MAEDNNILHYNFDEIIHYNNIDNVISNFTGYTIDTKNKTIKLNISDLNSINTNSKKEELLNLFNDAKKASEKVPSIQRQVNSLQNQTKNIQKNIDNPIHNANEKPIVGGMGQNTGIDHRGIYSHEINNPNKGIRIVNGAIGYYRNGDKEFQPILTSDGLLPDAINQIININKQASQNENGNNDKSANGGNTSSSSNNNNNSNNNDINLLELPSTNIRDNEGKRVIEVDYLQNDSILYKELIGRDDNGKLVQLVLCDKDDTIIKTTQYIRDDKGKITNIIPVYY